MEHCLSLKGVQTNCFSQICIVQAQMEHNFSKSFVNTVPLDRDGQNN